MLSTYVFVRLVHVLGVGLLLGGAATIWLALRVTSGTDTTLLRWYEGLFWFVLGVVVFTGTGNLAGFGAGLRGTDRWLVLSVKLGFVLVVVAGSLVRTFAVARLGSGETTNRRLRWLYAATALFLSLIVALAGVLARG